MIQGPRFQIALKALLLLALALFLYTRLAGGTLYYYINERFATYTLLAIVGLILVAVSYRPMGRRPHQADGASPTRDELPLVAEDHAHDHEHNHHHEHNHQHALTLSGTFLILLPVVLGVLVPPQPLGTAALANREVNITRQGSSLPAAVRAAAAKNAADKNVLDWLNTFAGAPDPDQAFAGQPANVVGFVFRDERFARDQFMVTRFVVSCCVADANVAGMVVQWPAAAELPADQWVTVSGVLQAGTLGNESVPVLAAQSVTRAEVPQQPYLYP